MSEKVFKGLFVITSGVCAVKAYKMYRYYKIQKELYEIVEEK